jgi:hypothetical protein
MVAATLNAAEDFLTCSAIPGAGTIWGI